MATNEKKKQIVPAADVHAKHYQGAAFATAQVNKGKSSGAGKKKARSKIKRLKPPPEGWKVGVNC